METKDRKVPRKKAGSQLRQISKNRRAGSKPSNELIEVLKSPAKKPEVEKSAGSINEVEI